MPLPGPRPSVRGSSPRRCCCSAPDAYAACCYFSAKNADILQPAQKVFITWDPVEKVETFTVQPKFEGNALDFGMVIPTPTQPKLHEMPRDFFKHLAVYTILKKREFPQSKLLPHASVCSAAACGWRLRNGRRTASDADGDTAKPPTVNVLEAGVVGSLDYKIIEAEPGRRPVRVAQGQQVQLRRRRGDARLLRAEEVALHRHEDRHHADEEEQGRHLRRRSHADALPVRQRASSSIR